MNNSRLYSSSTIRQIRAAEASAALICLIVDEEYNLLLFMALNGLYRILQYLTLQHLFAIKKSIHL